MFKLSVRFRHLVFKVNLSPVLLSLGEFMFALLNNLQWKSRKFVPLSVGCSQIYNVIATLIQTLTDLAGTLPNYTIT